MHCSAGRREKMLPPPPPPQVGGGKRGADHHSVPSPGLGLVNEEPGEMLGFGCLEHLLPGNGWDLATIHEAKIHHGLCSAALEWSRGYSLLGPYA